MSDPNLTSTLAYVVTTEWRASPGNEARVAEICDELTSPSRAEPGNLFFQTLRSPGDPRLFYLYEEYVDEAAYDAHLGSEHFGRLVEREVLDGLLEADASESFEAKARLVSLSPAVPHGPVRTPPARRAGRHGGSALRAFVEGGHTDGAALERVVGSAVILDLTPADARVPVDVAALDRAESRLQARGETIGAGDILLLRTDWTERTIDSPHWFRHSPSLTPAAADWLIAQRPGCIGCDFFEPDAPVQHQILDAGIPLVDGLVNLGVLAARCEFFAPFYDFGGRAEVPARAFAWAWEAA